ncbi:MAG: hypothetical protein GXO87_12240 [Chlorobi bacterium]|nr:hypothetical protein [Chlorobiota bacterium]
MNEKDFKILENIFLTSSSSEELFDAFDTALKGNIGDLEIYKILLANPALSIEEIEMYVKILSQKFPSIKYDLFMWAAFIFETYTHVSEYLEKATEYYAKAADMDFSNCEPYISMLKNYDYDLKLPVNKTITNFIESRLNLIKCKSKIYSALAKHYGKLGDGKKKAKYLELYEKAVREEN